MPQPPTSQPYDYSTIGGPSADGYDYSTLRPPSIWDQDTVLANVRDLGRAVVGAGQGVLQTLHGANALLAKPFEWLGAKDPQFDAIQQRLEGAATPQTTPAAIGKGAEQIGEFYGSAGLATELAGVVRMAPRLRLLGYSRLIARYGKAAVDGALQAMGAGGTAALHGESPTAPAVLSGVAPFIAPTASLAKPWLQKRAIGTVRDFLAESLPARVARSDRGNRQLTRAAGDALHLKIPSSWKRWDRYTSTVQDVEGAELAATLAGPAGDAPIPTATWHQVMDDAMEAVSRKVPLDAAGDDLAGPALNQALQHLAGVGPGGYRTVPIDRLLYRALQKLKDEVGQDAITARDLHDIKAVWDQMVFGPGGQRGQQKTLAEMVASARSAAANVAANGLRQLFAQEAPDIAQADQIFSRAKRLHDYVVTAMLDAQGAKQPLVQQILPHTVGQISRAGLFSALGSYGGYHVGGLAGSVGGLVAGATTARLLEVAMKAPGWNLLGARAQYALAQALANGNVDQVRRLLTPVVAGTLHQRPSRDTVSSAVQSLLDQVPAGTHTLSDGSVWVKDPTGWITAGEAVARTTPSAGSSRP